MEIKKIPLEHMGALVELVNGAYPGIANYDEAGKQRIIERFKTIQQDEPTLNFYGCYLNNELIGAMRLHDFKMNWNGVSLSVGGVGLVAVDLLHKKEKVAKALISYFIEHYHKQKFPMTLLYPFRPDFYKKMGFGFGTKMDRYHIKPSAFRNYNQKNHLRYLTVDDKHLVSACYDNFQKQTHGMIEKNAFELDQLFTRTDQKVLGYEKDGRLYGYFPFTFKKAHETNTMINDLQIGELIYLDSNVLKQFSTFFNSQSDQVNRIVVTTQDPDFHFLFDDPRTGSNDIIPHIYHETNLSGVGLMYRVNNIPLLFEQINTHSFGKVNLKLKLIINDSFYPDNNTITYLEFKNGAASVMEEGDFEVSLSLDVSDFSSLIMGSVSFASLYKYGLIEVSDPTKNEVLENLFFTPNKPVCRTGF